MPLVVEGCPDVLLMFDSLAWSKVTSAKVVDVEVAVTSSTVVDVEVARPPGAGELLDESADSEGPAFYAGGVLELSDEGE